MVVVKLAHPRSENGVPVSQVNLTEGEEFWVRDGVLYVSRASEHRTTDIAISCFAVGQWLCAWVEDN